MSWQAEIEECGVMPVPMSELFEARASTIEGQGVFAKQRLPEGYVLGSVRGPRYRDYDSLTCVEADDEWVIEPTDAGVPVHRMNHSCQPNCQLRQDYLDLKEIVVETLRVIPAGEELTIDYRWLVEPPFIPCRCGSPYCRGWVASSVALKQAGLLDTPLL